MIALAQPVIGDREREYVMDVLRTTRLSMGPYVHRLERAMAERTRRRHAIAVNNGTAALHLTMAALDIGPADIVLMPALSDVATANAVRYCDARPMFVDVDPRTWQMDPAALEKALTRWGKAVRAIVAVDLYGGIGPVDQYHALADKAGIPLVFDAAESIGATYGTAPAGSFGWAACFSLFGNKTVTCGEGGVIVTDDTTLAERMKLLRGQGQAPEGPRYFHRVIGFNYRMTDLQAAVAVAQLEQLDAFVAQRRQVIEWYRCMMPLGVVMQEAVPACTPSGWLMAVALDPKWGPASIVDRDAVMAELLAHGIETRPTFVPLHTLPMYTAPVAHLPETEHLGRAGICLPTHPGITLEDVGTITRALQHAIFNRAKAAGIIP